MQVVARRPRSLSMVADKAKIAAVQAAGRVFDRRFAARTEGRIELEELGLDNTFRVEYQPSAWRTLPRVLRRWEVDEDDVFLDVGCGMGRIVLEAAMRYRMKRVVGLELSVALAGIAEQNVRRNRKRLQTPVEIVAGDVDDYDIPSDVTVVYLYNPFGGPILAHFIQRLVESVDRTPRRVRIIYANPQWESVLEATGRIHRIAYGRSLLGRPREGNPSLRVYEIAPAPAAHTVDASN
jgi:predicted RNA methylase